MTHLCLMSVILGWELQVLLPVVVVVSVSVASALLVTLSSSRGVETLLQRRGTHLLCQVVRHCMCSDGARRGFCGEFSVVILCECRLRFAFARVVGWLWWYAFDEVELGYRDEGQSRWLAR